SLRLISSVSSAIPRLHLSISDGAAGLHKKIPGPVKPRDFSRILIFSLSATGLPLATSGGGMSRFHARDLRILEGKHVRVFGKAIADAGELNRLANLGRVGGNRI